MFTISFLLQDNRDTPHVTKLLKASLIPIEVKREIKTK